MTSKHNASMNKLSVQEQVRVIAALVEGCSINSTVRVQLTTDGLSAYRDAVEAGLAIAQSAARLIEDTPYTELVRPPGLSVVLFRRPGWDKSDYERWSATLLANQTGFVTVEPAP